MRENEIASSVMQQRKAQIDQLMDQPRSAHVRLVYIVTGVVMLLTALLSVGIGSVSIPPLMTIRILLAHLGLLTQDPTSSGTFETILLNIRLPRVILVAITGAALTSSGAAYQGLFRNPLADPYLIGAASGAGLGAIIMLTLRVTYPSLVALTVPTGAFVASLLTVVLVYVLSRTGQTTPTTTLILAGVAVSSLTSAISTFLILRSGNEMIRVLAFLLGGYGNASWDSIMAVLPFALGGFTILYIYARPLNILLLDEEQAQQLGIHVERVKLIVVLAATMITAAAVAFSGLIGFVGLIVPHTMRLIVGPDHHKLLPLSALGGMVFLMLADLIARTVIAPEELPVGIVTALAGAPFFLYLLRRAKRAAFF